MIQVCEFHSCPKPRNKQRGTKIVWHNIVRCVLHFALSLPTDTAVPLSHGEDGLLWGENCTGQLNMQRQFVALGWNKYQNCDKLRKWYFLLVLNIFVQTDTKKRILDKQLNVSNSHDCSYFYCCCCYFSYS